MTLLSSSVKYKYTVSFLFFRFSHRIIFFKIWSRHNRTNDSQQCPDGNCYYLKITLKDGDRSKIRTCFGAQYLHFVDTRVCFRWELGLLENIGQWVKGEK